MKYTHYTYSVVARLPSSSLVNPGFIPQYQPTFSIKQVSSGFWSFLSVISTQLLSILIQWDKFGQLIFIESKDLTNTELVFFCRYYTVMEPLDWALYLPLVCIQTICLVLFVQDSAWKQPTPKIMLTLSAEEIKSIWAETEQKTCYNLILSA